MSDYNPQEQTGGPADWSAATSPMPSPNVQQTMQQMTDQMQAVIEAAERAAEAIRFDAEEQARRHLAEAQRKADRLTAERVGLISELTDDLMRHASTVHEHSEQMIRALEGAITSITAKFDQPGVTGEPGASFEDLLAGPDSTGLGGEVKPGLAPPPPHMPMPPPTSAPPPVPPPPDLDQNSVEDREAGSAGDQEVPLEAVVYAAQLAMNGTDPTVIASELSKRYGIEDPDPVVRQVVGP